jgi:L-threonylcarbamoyladenylate synthase
MAMTRVLHVEHTAPAVAAIDEAAVVLRRGGLVAFPTETVYGLGANALDAAAVARIFAAKGRPESDPLIVHLATADDIARVAQDVPPIAYTLADRFWPGPLTLILAKRKVVPDSVTAGLPTVAVRVPSHPVARALIEAAGVPVAAPSANRFSRPSPTRADHVVADLGELVDLVLDAGATTIGLESTILDLTQSPPVIRRPGGISREAIAAIVPDVVSTAARLSPERAQPAPGQLTRHYAPRARTTLYIGAIAAVAARVSTDVRHAVASGERVGVLAPEEDLAALAPRLAAIGSTGRVVSMRCGSRDDLPEIARELFRALRDLDAEGVDIIYAIAPAAEGIGVAIIDRLTRASEGNVIWIT